MTRPGRPATSPSAGAPPRSAPRPSSSSRSRCSASRLTLLVFRSIVVPLRRLNRAMGAHDRRPLRRRHPAAGRDEIGTMAQDAGAVPRQQRRAGAAGSGGRASSGAPSRRPSRRCRKASLCSMPNDRLVIANSRYRAAVPGHRGHHRARPAVRGDRSALSSSAASPTLASLSADDWVERRARPASHAPRASIEQHYADGRWVRISEKKDAGRRHRRRLHRHHRAEAAPGRAREGQGARPTPPTRPRASSSPT